MVKGRGEKRVDKKVQSGTSVLCGSTALLAGLPNNFRVNYPDLREG